jgi:hypothetical protein
MEVDVEERRGRGPFENSCRLRFALWAHSGFSNARALLRSPTVFFGNVVQFSIKGRVMILQGRRDAVSEGCKGSPCI